jgi:hypothetical protein
MPEGSGLQRRKRLMLEILGRAVLIAALLALLVALAAAANGQTVPTEVKQAAIAALKASDVDGIHEEAFKWGKDKDGNVLISMSTPGKPCANGLCTEYLVAANPEIDARLVTVDGFAHVHPRGNARMSAAQPPSKEDLYFAAVVPGTVNIVIGAENHLVYFFDGKGIISTIKWKEFIKSIPHA